MSYAILGKNKIDKIKSVIRTSERRIGLFESIWKTNKSREYLEDHFTHFAVKREISQNDYNWLMAFVDMKAILIESLDEKKQDILRRTEGGANI